MIGSSFVLNSLLFAVVAVALSASATAGAEPLLPVSATHLSAAASANQAQDPPAVDGSLSASPVQRVALESSLTLETIERVVPDPQAEHALLKERLAGELSPGDRRHDEAVLQRIERLRRPVQVRMGLDEALARALAYSYAIRIQSYNPAVEMTRVIEAQAAFDPLFFFNMTREKSERPSGSPQLTGTTSNSLSLSGGVRKLLPTGMQVTTSYTMTRSSSDNPFQVLDPVYFGQLQMEMRQPLARGFGLDFNRSLIHIARNNQSISDQAFRRQVRDTVLSVERAYWDLVRARREVVISARLLSELEQVLAHLNARKDFDVVPIQLYDTEARLERTKAAFVRTLNNVGNAEDALIALMNDPALNLADDVEIVPTAVPTIHGLLVDRLGEVQTALDNRPEIREADLAVKSARLFVGRQKNATLPRMDFVFRYSVDGLGISADDSFDEVTKHDFTEYFVGFDFDIPVGNRAPRAAWRRSELEHKQALARLSQAFEQVILDVNVRVRDLQGNFDQLDPNYKSVVAARKQVDSIVARAERKDFTQLSAELNARESLAASRRNLLNAAIDYNLAIVELERAKGTLLGYNGIVITDPGSATGATATTDPAPSRVGVGDNRNGVKAEPN